MFRSKQERGIDGASRQRGEERPWSAIGAQNLSRQTSLLLGAASKAST